jgi:hypothetical protein
MSSVHMQCFWQDVTILGCGHSELVLILNLDKKQPITWFVNDNNRCTRSGVASVTKVRAALLRLGRAVWVCGCSSKCKIAKMKAYADGTRCSIC